MLVMLIVTTSIILNAYLIWKTRGIKFSLLDQIRSIKPGDKMIITGVKRI